MAILNDKAKKILNALFDYKELSEEVLCLIYGKRLYSKKIINMLIKNKFIKKSNLKIKVANKVKYDNISIHITQEGREELSRTRSDLEKIDKRRRVGGAKWIERIMKTSDSVLICCVAGCIGYKKAGEPDTMYALDRMDMPYIGLSLFTDQEKNVNDQLVRDLIKNYGIIYSMTDIRRELKHLTQDGNHWNSSSATGLLLAKNGPYMVYYANNGYLAMARSGERNFSVKLMTYLMAHGIYKEQYEMMDGIRKAIIFVRDKISLRRLIQNTFRLNYRAFQEFNSTYIIPITQEGANYLNLITQNPDFRQRLLGVLMNQYNCVANPDLFNTYKYPLKTADEILIYYGIEMDLYLLNEVYQEDTEMYIVCIDWQKEYYRSIFGERASYITITQQAIERMLH